MESKRFAWFPTTVTSGQRIWLNTFYEHKSLYDSSTGRPPLNGLYFIWTETEKEKIIRLLKEGAVQNRNVWNDPILTKEDKLWPTAIK
jgi:hypothetical protein